MPLTDDANVRHSSIQKNFDVCENFSDDKMKIQLNIDLLLPRVKILQIFSMIDHISAGMLQFRCFDVYNSLHFSCSQIQIDGRPPVSGSTAN